MQVTSARDSSPSADMMSHEIAKAQKLIGSFNNSAEAALALEVANFTPICDLWLGGPSHA